MVKKDVRSKQSTSKVVSSQPNPVDAGDQELIAKLGLLLGKMDSKIEHNMKDIKVDMNVKMDNDSAKIKKTLVESTSASSSNSKKTYDLILNVSDSVASAHSKRSETDSNLTEVSKILPFRPAYVPWENLYTSLEI